MSISLTPKLKERKRQIKQFEYEIDMIWQLKSLINSSITTIKGTQFVPYCFSHGIKATKAIIRSIEYEILQRVVSFYDYVKIETI